MAINSGKRFEQNIKKSVPKNVYYYRFKDGTANFEGFKNNNVRFQSSNICDQLLFDSEWLHLFEAKSHKGKSIPLTCIRDNQIKGLSEARTYKNISAGLVVEFSDLKRVFWLDIKKFVEFTNAETRKSIPLCYFETNGIEAQIELKKVNISINIKKLLSDIKNMQEEQE